ncbi:DUF2798 domain-containing protein [Methylophilus sp. 5]|uniref:DUF2798 domain-containing protein n=1 Tax=Methylophilus sp. 5 TaxID=1112274 RepID=UPI00049174BB|nr:DUF2798 domain-containing protein [Methylophilus sp. 5]
MQYKLARKYTPLVFAFYMSAVMALLMCMVIVAINTGLAGDYVSRVINAYMLAMPSAFVFLQLVRPLVMKLVNATVAT